MYTEYRREKNQTKVALLSPKNTKNSVDHKTLTAYTVLLTCLPEPDWSNDRNPIIEEYNTS